MLWLDFLIGASLNFTTGKVEKSRIIDDWLDDKIEALTFQLTNFMG